MWRGRGRGRRKTGEEEAENRRFKRRPKAGEKYKILSFFIY